MDQVKISGGTHILMSRGGSLKKTCHLSAMLNTLTRMAFSHLSGVENTLICLLVFDGHSILVPMPMTNHTEQRDMICFYDDVFHIHRHSSRHELYQRHSFLFKYIFCYILHFIIPCVRIFVNMGSLNDYISHIISHII
jgi:hypothetical protein